MECCEYISGQHLPLSSKSCLLFSEVESSQLRYFAPQIFSGLGIDSNTTSLLASGVVGIVMFVATIPTILYLDKFGRKPVMFFGAIGMGLCQLTVAVILAKNEKQWSTHRPAGWAAIAIGT